MDAQLRPTVTIKLQVAKFDGDITPGKAPVEVIETEETISVDEFNARQAAAGGE